MKAVLSAQPLCFIDDFACVPLFQSHFMMVVNHMQFVGWFPCLASVPPGELCRHPGVCPWVLLLRISRVGLERNGTRQRGLAGL
jgi:hypothetical protein